MARGRGDRRLATGEPRGGGSEAPGRGTVDAETLGGPDHRIGLGVVLRPHGLHGEVRVRPWPESAARILAVSELLVAGESTARPVERVRLHHRHLILKLRGVDELGAAEALRGRQLEIPAGELSPLPADTFYCFDLEGCNVVDLEGTELGRVVAVEQAGGGDLLVVETASRAAPTGRSRELLVPFVRAIVRTVDLAGRRIAIDPPDGLLDL